MNRPLTRSIIATIISFLILQAVLFGVLARVNGIDIAANWAFFPVSLGFHALTLVFLLYLRADFFIEASGRKLERVNLANVLTLIRISTLPTILFLIKGAIGRRIPPATFVLTALVLLTDLLDGFVSRTMKQGTKIGRMLDSISDYCLLAVLAIVLSLYRFIHAWYFALVVARLFFQAAGMAIFFLAKHPIEPKPTFFGKVTVASTMIIFGLSILKNFLPEGFAPIFLALEITAACLVAISMVDKGIVFARHIPRKDRS
jgi:phosphatidylglycerophosphate synthase